MTINVHNEMNALMEILTDTEMKPLEKNYKATKWLTNLQRSVNTGKAVWTPKIPLTPITFIPWGGTTLKNDDVDLGGS